jgi:tetratricopeptide (TPR) repeat protein
VILAATFLLSRAAHADGTPGRAPGRGEPAESPRVSLERANAHYLRGDYQQVVDTLKQRVELLGGEDLVRAHFLMGASYVYLRRPDEARQSFDALLRIEPDYTLRVGMEDPDVYAIFNTTRDAIEDDLAEIRKKRREQLIRDNPPREITITREIRSDSAFVNFIPFGVGQFRNGHRSKGIFFLAGESAFLATSVTLFSYQLAAYGFPVRVPQSEVKTANILRVTQVATGGAFILMWIIGTYDAFAFQKPKITTTRTETPLTSRIPTVTPWVAGDGSAAGLGLSWEL